MSKRSDNIGFKVMPNGNIRAYRTDKADKRGVSELMVTYGGVSPRLSSRLTFRCSTPLNG